MADATKRVVVVTGAAGRIGRALLARFRRVGAVTAGIDLRRMVDDTDPAADLWVPGNVTDPANMRAAMRTVRGEFGRIDVLVVNAGVTALGTLAGTAPDVFERVMAVNLHGAINATHAAIDDLTKVGGNLVVVSSVAGFAPVAGRPAYAASKHAVTGLFESSRPELARRGITLTMVHPTFLATAPETVPEVGHATARTTTGRLLEADDVAREVVRGVRRGRSRVLPGATAKAAWYVHRISPTVFGWLMTRRLTASEETI
jgi:NAD(P)-dependent dehydrogenase (short-subunit alcohol dehydrogenase family)